MTRRRDGTPSDQSPERIAHDKLALRQRRGEDRPAIGIAKIEKAVVARLPPPRPASRSEARGWEPYVDPVRRQLNIERKRLAERERALEIIRQRKMETDPAPIIEDIERIKLKIAELEHELDGAA